MILLTDEQIKAIQDATVETNFKRVSDDWVEMVNLSSELTEKVQRAIAKAQVKKVVDYLWGYSTACSAPNPWEIIAITLTKEQWQALLDEVKEGE